MNRKLIPACLLFAGFISCNTNNSPVNTITVTNDSSVSLNDKPVIIKRQALANIPQENRFPLVTTNTGDTVAAQLDDTDRDGKWDQLFFVADFKPREERKFQLSWTDAPIKLNPRSHIRFGVRQTMDSHVEPAISDTFYADQLPGVIGYQHYQTDGPTWENDKAGFRLYLDGRNSIDVFGKKVSYITSDSIGIGKDGHTENNYSDMKDWGTDILAVGNSVGIGGVSLLIKDSLARLGVTEQDSLNNVDTTIFNIVSNGPVHSLMEFDYRGWKALNRNYHATMNTSIWPGMYAFQNTVSLQNLTGDETLVVGLVNSNTTRPLKEIFINDKWVVLLTHDQQSVNKTWWLGLALILPKEDYLGYMEAPKQGKLSTTFLAKLKVKNGQPVTYYAVAAWELSNEQFKDEAYFTDYVHNLTEQLAAGLKITVN